MENIFSTKERIKILNAVIFSEQPGVNVITARFKYSKFISEGTELKSKRLNNEKYKS